MTAKNVKNLRLIGLPLRNKLQFGFLSSEVENGRAYFDIKPPKAAQQSILNIHQAKRAKARTYSGKK